MGRNTSETVRIEQRRRQVSDLYLKGRTQVQIAEKLGVSQATISNDIKAMLKRWREDQNADMEELVLKRFQQLELVRREAWDAWEQSRKPTETTRVTQGERGRKAEKTVRQQHGDPRYLQILQSTNQEIAKLLHLDEWFREKRKESQKWADGKVPPEFWDIYYTLTDSDAAKSRATQDPVIERFIAGEDYEAGEHIPGSDIPDLELEEIGTGTATY